MDARTSGSRAPNEAGHALAAAGAADGDDRHRAGHAQHPRAGAAGPGDAACSDTGTVQLTLSLYLLGLGRGPVAARPLSDRFGRRPVVLAGCDQRRRRARRHRRPTIDALIGARVVQAVGASTGIVIGRAIIRDLYERDRAAAMIGLVTTAMVIAPMISPLIGGILDTTFGWEAIFLFIAAFSGVVLLGRRWCCPRRAPQRGAGARMLVEHWRALLASANFYGYVLCGAIGSAPFFTFLGGGPHVVVTRWGAPRPNTACGSQSRRRLYDRQLHRLAASQRFGVDAMIMAGIGSRWPARA